MLETTRLVLRAPVEADLEPWGDLLRDAEVMQFVGGPQDRPIDWLRLAMFGSWRPPHSGMLSVIEKTTNQWIGRIGAWGPQGWPSVEIGWTLARGAWGRGFATEGAAAAIDWALSDLGLTDIVHLIMPENAAAIAVARRLGSKYRHTTRLPSSHRNMSVGVWGQTPAEWELNRSRLGRVDTRSIVSDHETTRCEQQSSHVVGR